jgi:hypothetical protein
VLGIVGVALLLPPTYTVTSTLLLVPPAPAPSDAQLFYQPELAGVNSDNPYTRVYDPVTMIAVMSSPVVSERGRERIARGGGTTTFEVDQVVRYGQATPFAEVTA